MKKVLAGINIQWPWSQLLLSGVKTIETRSYPIPKKYIGVELAIIETPGPSGKFAGVKKAQIVGTIIFSDSFKYTSAVEWKEDFDRHKVEFNSSQFRFQKGAAKWGWPVVSVQQLPRPQKAPRKKGIIYTSRCEINQSS